MIINDIQLPMLIHDNNRATHQSRRSMHSRDEENILKAKSIVSINEAQARMALKQTQIIPYIAANNRAKVEDSPTRIQQPIIKKVKPPQQLSQYFISPYNNITQRLYELIHKYTDLKKTQKVLKAAIIINQSLSISQTSAEIAVKQDKSKERDFQVETINEIIQSLNKPLTKPGQDYQPSEFVVMQEKIIRAEKKLLKKIQKVERSIQKLEKLKNWGVPLRKSMHFQRAVSEMRTIGGPPEFDDDEEYVGRQKLVLRNEREAYERQLSIQSVQVLPTDRQYENIPETTLKHMYSGSVSVRGKTDSSLNQPIQLSRNRKIAFQLKSQTRANTQIANPNILTDWNDQQPNQFNNREFDDMFLMSQIEGGGAGLLNTDRFNPII